MRKLNLLFSLCMSNDKRDVCVKLKSSKKTCKPILSKKIEFLCLVYSDLRG